MPELCICNRYWDHCKVCGSKNIYWLSTESRIATAKAISENLIQDNEKVIVHRCKRCGNSSDRFTPCVAEKIGSENSNTTFIVEKEKSVNEIDTNAPLPEGWKESDGKIESPVSLNDIISKK